MCVHGSVQAPVSAVRFRTVRSCISLHMKCTCVQELIDWASTDPVLKQVADPRRVYLLGHSRGAKVATLAAAQDTRVAALCLVDPVDNTVYAPLGPGFPSAAAALQKIPESRPLPVAIIGTFVITRCHPLLLRGRH